MIKNMKIAIIGLGFVGLTFASVLASKGFKVIGIDIDIKKSRQIADGIPPFYEDDLEKTLKIGLKKNLAITNNFSSIIDCDVIFITVGTPQKKDGSIELAMIKRAVTVIGKTISKTRKNPIILVKSTVTPGTMQHVIRPILEKQSGKKAGKDFGLISNPEFLQESSAIKDTKFPHVIVLGGYKTKFMSKMKKIFANLHPKIPIIITNHQTAEMIKYANNSFLATKISFINQLANICQNIPGADIDDIAKTIGLDPRIGNLFLNAGPGYGGSCLPKDMKALINFANKVGIKPKLLDAVEEINLKQLEQIIIMLEEKLGTLRSKRITILGTAFKPNTDDIRDSVGIELIKKLLKKRATVTIYDPKSMNNTMKVFGDEIFYAKSLPSSLNNSECLIIMTQWKQFEILNNKLIKSMKRKLIVDCRRILSKKILDADYHAIGIGN